MRIENYEEISFKLKELFKLIDLYAKTANINDRKVLDTMKSYLNMVDNYSNFLKD